MGGKRDRERETVFIPGRCRWSDLDAAQCA